MKTCEWSVVVIVRREVGLSGRPHRWAVESGRETCRVRKSPAIWYIDRESFMERSGDLSWRPSGRCWGLRTSPGRSVSPFLAIEKYPPLLGNWEYEKLDRVQGRLVELCRGFPEAWGGYSGGSRGPRLRRKCGCAESAVVRERLFVL